MKLNRNIWSNFSTYLFTERKISTNSSSFFANKSRFNKIIDYFEKREFNRDNFNTYIESLREKYSNSYINNIIKLSKHLDRFLKLNIIQDYTYFHESKKYLPEIITPEEITQLAEYDFPYQKMRNIINARQKALIYLLGTTGCRIGEALTLKSSDIFNEPTRVIFRDTKNGENRVVPIAKFLYDLLISLPPGNKVFNSGRGGLLELQQINRDLKARANSIKIGKDISAHWFRHSYITTMLEAGTDWLDLSIIVGHKDPKTTLRYKQSLLGHYIGVTQNHPLLQAYTSIDDLKARIKDFIDKSVNTKYYSVNLVETKESIKIEICA